jgi:hypothetical protein
MQTMSWILVKDFSCSPRRLARSAECSLLTNTKSKGKPLKLNHMKKILLASAAAVLLSAQMAFSQGQINFDNRANAAGTPGEFPGVVIAPIFNVGGTLPLFNTSQTTYTATLWALKSVNVTGTAVEGANNLALVGTTTMRTSTSGTSAGRVAAPSANPVVPDVVPGTTDRATFQVRVWDTKGGTITTWDQALTAFRSGQTAIGYSTLFTVPYALTSGIGTPPNLEGLQSFSLVVPEPSVIALGVLGAGCLLLLRRRK